MALLRKMKTIGAVLFLTSLCLLYKSTDKEQFESSYPQWTKQTTTESEISTAGLKEIPYSMFKYPLDVDMQKLIHTFKAKGRVKDKPIFTYPHHSVLMPHCKCGCSEVKDTKMHTDNASQVFILLLVKSAPPNFKNRAAIRYTWGSEDLLKRYPIKRVFLLARSTKEEEQRGIVQEASVHDDILLLSYFDAYYNNTYKTVGGLKWAVEYCKNAKFVLFMDDDFYLNPVILVQYLNGLSARQRRRLFMGKINPHDTPERRTYRKWYIPLSVYPYDRFPPFISAGFMALSMDVVIDLRIAVQYTKKFIFDDVFLAIAIKKIGLKPTHHNQIQIHGAETTIYKIAHRNVTTILAAHGFGETNKLLESWRVFKTHYEKTLPIL